ncbi:MAG TPA: amidohydrolase family protein [Stellaceae bacterium]|jgi:2,3-dihydroxybenzoate decarboxylase|nr:amidohydrolase family protein [Stellaceae bacterium]
MAITGARPPARERIAVEEGFMIPEVAAAARALDERLGAGAPTELRRAMFRDLLDLGEGRLKAMDEDGITKQVIVIGSPGVQAFDPVQGHELSKLVNDRLSAACRPHPDRFAGLAAVAPQAPENAARELERAVKALGLKGAHINSHTHGEYLDDKKFWAIFESAEALDVPIYIHPREPSPGMAGPLAMPGFRVAWGYAIETGTHIMRLIAGGVFDQFPRLKIVIGHMGENIPFTLDRIDNRYLWETAMAGMVRQIKRLPSEYFRDNVIVTTSGMNYRLPLLMTIETLGIDNVLFAGDWPFEVVRDSVDVVDALPIADADKEKLYHLNAKRVFKL